MYRAHLGAIIALYIREVRRMIEHLHLPESTPTRVAATAGLLAASMTIAGCTYESAGSQPSPTPTSTARLAPTALHCSASLVTAMSRDPQTYEFKEAIRRGPDAIVTGALWTFVRRSLGPNDPGSFVTVPVPESGPDQSSIELAHTFSGPGQYDVIATVFGQADIGKHTKFLSDTCRITSVTITPSPDGAATATSSGQ